MESLPKLSETKVCLGLPGGRVVDSFTYPPSLPPSLRLSFSPPDPPSFSLPSPLPPSVLFSLVPLFSLHPLFPQLSTFALLGYKGICGCNPGGNLNLQPSSPSAPQDRLSHQGQAHFCLPGHGCCSLISYPGSLPPTHAQCYPCPNWPPEDSLST